MKWFRFSKTSLDKIPDSMLCICRICGKPVPIESANTNGFGQPVHENCYLREVHLEHASHDKSLK